MHFLESRTDANMGEPHISRTTIFDRSPYSVFFFLFFLYFIPSLDRSNEPTYDYAFFFLL